MARLNQPPTRCLGVDDPAADMRPSRRRTIKVVQSGLLACYRAVAATGALNTSWGRALFEQAYWLYKGRYEAGPVRALRQWVKPGTVVVDVGANVGFFTLQFASWVGENGKVLALEPEALNFARLQRALERARVTAVVEPLQVAVADTTGEGLLELNPDHPGDHKLGTTGVKVPLTTLDAVLAGRGWPEVSLIKVDVQGMETRVLAGAGEIVRRFRPTLFLEVDDRALRHFGSSARELLESGVAHGYTLHTLTAEGPSGPLTLNRSLDLVAEKGYTDLLLLPAAGGGDT